MSDEQDGRKRLETQEDVHSDGMLLRDAQADFRQADQLLSRAMRLLIEWNIRYSEHQPSWLPPASFVTLAEDYEEFKIQRGS